MVGGRNYQKSQFNRVFQAKRQPGSIFKPFVYLAALCMADRAAFATRPTPVLNDSQFTWSYDGQEWQPNNYNNEYFGAVTFRRALESSLNSATGRVAQDVGIRRVRDLAHRLGIQSPLPAVPSLALGSAEVTPLEVAVAFSTLANNGVRTRPLGGQTGDRSKRQGSGKARRASRAGAQSAVRQCMNNLLKGVLDRGTAAKRAPLGIYPSGGRQNRHNQRLQRCLVCRLYSGFARGRLGWFRRPKQTQSVRRGSGTADLDGVHESATASMPVTDLLDRRCRASRVRKRLARRRNVYRQAKGEPASERCPPGTVPARTPSEVL